MEKTKRTLQYTLIASAVAAVAGGAFAADASPSLWADKPENVMAQTAPIDWKAVQADNAFELSGSTQQFLKADAGTKTFDGRLWVVGKDEGAKATGLWASGQGVKVFNNGKIYVTSEGNAKPGSQHAMGAGNFAQAFNEGTIVARNANGMYVDNSSFSVIVNKGHIYVEEQGAAMNLGGAPGSVAMNMGRIVVGHPSKDASTQGVLINAANNTFTNRGIIAAKSSSAHAIEITGAGKNSTINLEAGSSVTGIISIAEGNTGSTLNANGFKGTIDLDSHTKDLTVLVQNGAALNLGSSTTNRIKKTEITNGTLSAARFDQLDKVILNSGGALNFLLPEQVNNFKFTGEELVLAGGSLQINGQKHSGHLVIGNANKESKLDIQKGAYKINSLVVAEKSKANVAKDAALGVGKIFSVNKGAEMTVKGKLGFGEKAKLTVADKGSLTVDGGTLMLWNTQAFSGNKISEALQNTQFQNNAFVEIQNSTALTTQEIGAAQALFKEGSDANLSFANLKVKLTDEEKQNGIGFDTMLGTAMIGQKMTIGNPDGEGIAKADVGTATIGVGTLRVAEGTKTLKLTGEGGTTYFSGAEKLFEGSSLEKTEIDGTVYLGHAPEDTGVVNVKDFSVKTLKVIGRYSATNVETSDNATISGALKAASLSGGASTVNENGVLEASLVNADVTVEKDGLFVLGAALPEAPPAKQPAARAAAVAKPAEAFDVPDGPQARPAANAPNAASEPARQNPQINKGVVLESGATFAFSEASGKALQAEIKRGAFGPGIKSGFLVDAPVTVGEKGKLQIGNSPANDNQIAAGQDVVTIVNASKFGEKDVVFDAAKVTLAGKNRLENARHAQTLVLTNGTLEGSPTFELSNAFLSGTTKQVEKSTVLAVGLKDNAALKTDAATYGALKTIVNSPKAEKLLKLVSAVGESSLAGFFSKEGALTAPGAKAVKEAATIPVAAGLYNAAYDAAREVTGAVERRSLAPSSGFGAWADVFYAKNEAASLYGSHGYSGTVKGGTLGFDGQLPFGTTAGVAFSVGTADAKSEKTIGRYSTDSDFWAVTLYGGHELGIFRFSGDVSYLSFDNDLKGSLLGASVKEGADASVLTAGLRTDVTIWESDGKNFSIVPHAGLRYTKIDAENAFGLRSDSIDVFEMPVGVKFAGRFEPAAGWLLSPSLDLTAVPQIGDKKVGTIAGDVNVLNNVYNATLGVTAAKENVAFGLSYRYGFSTDDRADQVLQARVTFSF